VNAYKDEVGASQPEEDFDDRNRLYALVCPASTKWYFKANLI